MTKPNQIELDLPPIGFRKRMVFNRFEIDRLDETVAVFHFGLMRDSNGPLIDTFSCAMQVADVELNCERFKDYFSRMDSIEATKPSAWVVPFAERGLEAASVINMAHAGRSAEISLFTFSLFAATVSAHSVGISKARVQCDPVALLKCELGLEKSFLLRLFKFKK